MHLFVVIKWCFFLQLNTLFCVFVCQEVDVRFIEYMPFDGNKWSQRKMVPYAEMINLVSSRYPDLIRLSDSANDTSKVCFLYSFCILNFWYLLLLLFVLPAT